MDGDWKDAELMAVFDVKAPTESEEDFWQVQHTGIPAGHIGYRTRTIKAGNILEAEIYPICGRSCARQARKAREQLTPESIQRANNRAATKRITRLVNCNFTAEDIHLTLTYQGYPPAYEQVLHDTRNYLRRVQRQRKRMGMEAAKYIYVIEDNEDGRKKRIHVHLLISGGLEREELERMWKNGWANADRLQPNEEGLAAIAKYITKAQKNRKKWICSRGLKKPKVRTSDTKCSVRRVERIARTLVPVWKEELRKLYPGYEPVSCEVFRSDRMPGIYVYAQMRQIMRQ